MSNADTEQDFKLNALSIDEQQEQSRFAAYKWERLSLIGVVFVLLVLLIVFAGYKYQHTNVNFPTIPH